MVEKRNPSKVSKREKERSHFGQEGIRHLKSAMLTQFYHVTTNRDESEKAPPVVIIVVVGRHWP